MRTYNVFGLTGLLVLVCWLGDAPLAAEPPPRAEPPRPGSAQFPFDEHLPSSNPMRRGGRLYDMGRHYSAIHFYERAAWYGDKFGQHNLGVMHLRGEGTEFDPVKAWAWLELSAERGYPTLVETADALFDLLDEEQRQQARRHLEQELLPEYGDAVAVPRAQRVMDRGRRQATGTRAGGRAMMGRLRVIDVQGDGLGRPGDEFYDPDKWNMQRIIEYETWQMESLGRGRVEIGDTEIIEDEHDR